MAVNHIELAKLNTDCLLEFLSIDCSTIVHDPIDSMLSLKYNFHSYNIQPEDSNATDSSLKQKGVLVWQEDNYYPYPFLIEDIEQNADGSLPRPSLKLSNIFPVIKDLTINFGDLINATVTRKRVFYKNLDNLETADPTQIPSEEIFLINRKKTENQLMMQFDLVTPIESNNIQLPARQIFRNFCSWKYRENGCKFSKACVIDKSDAVYLAANDNSGSIPVWQSDHAYTQGVTVKYTMNGITHYMICKQNHTSNVYNRFHTSFWTRDECSHTVYGCQIRYGTGNVLPFGGFPGTTSEIS